ncbi:iturin family lipopeptide synthetase B/fengycin family lipopeptide synthetase D/tyrocidine synthetase-2, partial [Mucilaginibacter oryzae]
LHRDKTAVVSGSKSLTYQELDERSDLLAKYLVLNLNLKPGDRVGMLLERSEWMVVTMIGIMKANCAYVPIDKSMPLQRITFMISASSLHLLICDETPSDQHKDTLKVISTTELEAYKDDRKAPKPKVILDDVSFLIYTSGSTGNPKAVLQTHRTLYNLILWDINSIRMQQQGRHLQFSSFSFDSSIHDVFYALSTGGQIHIISEELRKDMFKLKDYIIKERISTLSMPYAALKVVFSEFDGEEFQGHQINEVISTGEQLYISGGMRRFLAINPDVELYNFYGPSETHVVTGVSYRYNRAEIPEKASIGKPVDNTYILILDERMQLVPIGVHGEIYIGGWNLAKGYDDNPELTSEKFIDDPFRPGLKIYKSGDIGKWHPDGTIEYLLRRDNQVKIRGYRVETGEVESAIRGYNLLEEAVVVVKENSLGDKELVAYFVSRHKIDRQELHSYLSERLPSYMLPVYYLQLDRIPLTSNGKINKQVLPVPGQADLLSSAEFVAPRNEVEAKLVEIWSDVLGISIDAIGVHDDFFSLGGHSLKATYAISRIRKTFSIAVSLAEFFMYPTVEGIGHIVQARGWLAQSSKVVTRKNLYEL